MIPALHLLGVPTQHFATFWGLLETGCDLDYCLLELGHDVGGGAAGGLGVAVAGEGLLGPAWDVFLGFLDSLSEPFGQHCAYK